MLMRRPFGRIGRPGLLGTMARTAVVAGTATAVVGGVQRHQQARAEQSAELQDYEDRQTADAIDEAARRAAAPPQTAAPTGADPVAELERLAALQQAGALTDSEFAAAKAKLLGLG